MYNTLKEAIEFGFITKAIGIIEKDGKYVAVRTWDEIKDAETYGWKYIGCPADLAEEETTEEPTEETTTETTTEESVEETETTKPKKSNIKWINEGNVLFNRGNYEPCIFKFDNSKVWFNSNAICTTQSIKSMARRMAQHYNAKKITIKYLWIDDKHTSEPRENVVDFIDDYYGENYKFRIELPVKEGEKRQFRYFEESEIFD